MAISKTEQVRVSKFLSLVLRHQPDAAGVTLDEAGWCAVDALLQGCTSHCYEISRDDLARVVEQNDKKRFQFSEDGARIRAVQGHSLDVDLDYQAQTPPEVLYHGTATRFLDSIKQQGLLKMSRQFVHLSATHETALKVGERHGKPVVLGVRAGEMHRSGTPFYRAANGVWLVDAVPPVYLRFPETTR
ncbi:RNA 2'-phosphotransferase [Occallatibacter riparius]|uniref:Probable RNA 2'-phosphotransferase n=1 Tax=Occallatibacter riparius TaxID=1002689 RepID=A0A9J7BRE1_9BACT|nr:RNA 2'-phosphotransferase [Occallatibacter riparius]UWZ83637.1 RNA 2'-phosphotransferase [Occallatibacter riparius]